MENLEERLNSFREEYTKARDAWHRVQGTEPSAAREEAKKLYESARKFYDEEKANYHRMKEFPTGDEADGALKTLKRVQHAMRRGQGTVARAVMTNFRYERHTSSFLTNYSYFRPGYDNSRCGLKLGAVYDIDQRKPLVDEDDLNEELKNFAHCGEYIGRVVHRHGHGLRRARPWADDPHAAGEHGDERQRRRGGAATSCTSTTWTRARRRGTRGGGRRRRAGTRAALRRTAHGRLRRENVLGI